MIEDVFNKSDLNRLARQMQNGEERAAAKLYEGLVKKVYGFCLNRVRNKTSAEDLTQEIFLKLVSRIEIFDPEKGDFVVWFWQLARNTVIDYYRRAKDLTFADLDGGEDAYAIPVQDTQTRVEKKLEREKIDKFLSSLSEEDQEIFRLRFLGELSYKEMAKILEKSEGALRVAVGRLKKKISNHLKNESPT